MRIYWTFKEFPSFFRHRSAGWLSFGYIRTVMLEKLTGGMSYLTWRVLDVFFSHSSFSFSLGCRCVVQGRSIHIRAAFAGFLGDEKGLKELANTKGASGSKPCPHCKNIVSKSTLREAGTHEYFVTISAPSYADLDLHSDETFWEMVDLLVRRAPCSSKKDLAHLTQALGLNYSPGTLLFQPRLRSLFSPTKGWLWDWMHCLVSHGIGNQELQFFTKAVCPTESH